MSMPMHMSMPFSTDNMRLIVRETNELKGGIKFCDSKHAFSLTKCTRMITCFNKLRTKCSTMPLQPLLQDFLQNILLLNIGTKIKEYFCKELQQQKC